MDITSKNRKAEAYATNSATHQQLPGLALIACLTTLTAMMAGCSGPATSSRQPSSATTQPAQSPETQAPETQAPGTQAPAPELSPSEEPERSGHPAPQPPGPPTESALANNTDSAPSGQSEPSGQTEPPATESPMPPKSTAETPAADPDATVAVAAGSAESSDPAGADRPSGAQALDGDAGAGSGPASEDTRSGSRRILLFGPDGPLVVEFALSIDGEPFDAPLERLIDDVLRTADTDGDGVPTWDELTASSSFRYGQFGNQPIGTLAEQLEVKRNYDAGDGRVDRYEVLRFLNSNQAGGGAFTLTSSNQFRGDNQTRSLVKQLLDADEDDRLSAEEIEAAPRRLRSRDADENDILFLDDFKAASSVAPQFGGMNMRRRSKRYGPQAAILLDPRTDWASLLVSLQELYAFGGNVGPEPFALAPAVFDQLDADGNRVLQAEELARWLNSPPHLRLSVRFGSPNGQANRQLTDQFTGQFTGGRVDAPRLELVSLHPALNATDPVISHVAGRLAITLPSVDLLFRVTDAAPSVDSEQAAQAQLMQLDTDGNGYLEASEFDAAAAPSAVPFEAIDSDGDGKIFLAELRRTIVRRQGAGRSQLRGYAADQEDALFSALDTDNDGRLTTREIDGAPRRLSELDTNDDGELTAREIPGSLLVTISRGPAAMDAGPLPYAPAPASAAEDLPAWFPPMDVNRDGDVSRLEFLGDDEKFAHLDRDGDGFIDAEEAGGGAEEESAE